jgi:hypothetical protein
MERFVAPVDDGEEHSRNVSSGSFYAVEVIGNAGLSHADHHDVCIGDRMCF